MCCQEAGPSLESDSRSKPEAGHHALRQVTGLGLCHRLIRKLGVQLLNEGKCKLGFLHH